MPFIAQNKNSGERIDISKFTSPREELANVLFECRFCKIQMFIRRSSKGKFHFYHQRCCISDFNYHPETPEHLAGKSFIATYVLPKLNKYATFNYLYEEPLQEVKRIADIVTKFPMGWWVANEIQLSPITSEELEERTRDYLKAGVDVIWWLGKGADTEQNRQWAIKTYGFSPFLVFKDEAVVKYGYRAKEKYVDEYDFENYIATHTYTSQDESEKSLALFTKIGDWWKKLAFARYYQVWKKGNNDLYRRALLVNDTTINYFSGIVGTGNVHTLFSKIKDLWFVNEKELYSYLKERHVSVLSENAISSIKEKAKKHRVSQS